MNNWNDIVNKPHTSGVYNVVYGTDESRFTTSCYFDGTDTWYHDVGINHDRIVTDKVMMWQPLPDLPEAINMNNSLLDLMIGYDNLANRITSKEYINKIAVEELFRDEIKEIQNSDSDCKRVLIDELERLLYYILQIPELELEQEG